MFGNLIENAVEACLIQADDAQKSILIKAVTKEAQLILLVKTTYQNQVIYKDGIYYSTKHDGAGIGLSSVKNIVEKNHGVMKIDYHASYFKIHILLNLSS